MSEEIRKIRSKPFVDYTEEERRQILSGIKAAINQGSKVILGYTRCFICGAELDKMLGKKQVGIDTPSVIINLCDVCYRNPAAQALIKDGLQ